MPLRAKRGLRRIFGWWLGANALGLIVLIALPGRQVANAHPWLRGGDGTAEGSDRGFGAENVG